MRIGRTLPPAAAPLSLGDVRSGFRGMLRGEKEVRAFEEEMRAYYGVGHCFAVSSGKAALFLILTALKKLAPHRNEVLIPGYTCYSVPSAIVRAGLKVRLCDMRQDGSDLDFEHLERELENPGILCVLPTHLLGIPADVERVTRIACRNDVFVIEDAAQAMGGEWKGKKLGTRGNAGFFSLGRGKAFSTVEGGIIVSNDGRIGSAIGESIAGLPGYGFTGSLRLFFYSIALASLVYPHMYWLPKSVPFLRLGETIFDPGFPIMRLSSFQAGIAKGWRKKLRHLQEVRSANVKRFARYGILPSCRFDDPPDLIRVPVVVADAEEKKRILAESERDGLGLSGLYPAAVNGIAELTELTGGEVPNATSLGERLITVPVHPFMRDEDIRRIAALLSIRRCSDA